MNVEELARYKNMSAEEIDRKIVPDIEDIKDKKNAENGRSLEDCFLSYLKKKAMLLD